MTLSANSYERLHLTEPWAYSEHPDSELVAALAEAPGRKAVDLGGGQGRHALYLARRGFDVELVDLSEQALIQAGRAALDEGLGLRTNRSNIAYYEPAGDLAVVVGALIFHVLARHAALGAAARLGDAMAPGAVFYFSLPGFNDPTRALAADLLCAAGCTGEPVKHVVTRSERPRLPVARRNETRTVGRRV